MTDLREPTTTPDPASGTSTTAAAGAGADPADPLQNLYRMSRTAGLGSGDYVAINNTSVLAFILGLAGVLSILYPLLLLVSAAAVVCGIMAFVQIRSSNGTQSGRAFAVLGILLGLGLGGYAGAKLAMAGVERHQDEAAIDGLVHRLSDLLAQQKYAEAYQTCFSDRFKSDFSEQDFASRFEAMTRYYGNVTSFDWGKKADIQSVRGTEKKRAAAGSIVKFGKLGEEAATPTIIFAKDNGQWKIDIIQQLFEKEKSKKGGGGQPDPRVPQNSPQFQLPGAPGAPEQPVVPTPSIPQG